MEKIDFNQFQKRIEKRKEIGKKKAKYLWQEMCVELANQLKVSKGLLFKAWTIGGYPLLNKIKGDISEYTPKNPTAYLLYWIKKFKNNK